MVINWSVTSAFASLSTPLINAIGILAQMSDTVKNFTKVSMRSRHMPQHRRGRDDGSPCCSRKVKLVAWNIETSTRCGERTVELIVGICHPILGKGGFQTTFIKRTVVGDKWKTLNQWFYLRPYFRKGWLTVCVEASETVDFCCPVCIIVRSRLNERIEFIDDLTSVHYHKADAAYA